MKKFFSLVLALVMALSLTTVAWGAPGTEATPLLATDKASLTTALTEGGYIKVENDFSIDSEILITNPVTIDLNNKTITGTGSRLFRITAGVEVTFKNGTIKNTADAGRCIETRTGDVTLNLNGVTLITTGGISGSDKPQPLTVGGSGTGIVVNITDSVIDAATGNPSVTGYGITTFNPVDMTITDSTVSGYIALNIKQASGSVGSAGSEFTVVGSTLISGNPYAAGTTNAGSVIMVEDKDVTIEIDADSTVSASAMNNPSVLFGVGNAISTVTVTGLDITVEDGAELDGTTIFAINDGSKGGAAQDIADNVLAVPAEYADELIAEGYFLTTDSTGAVVPAGVSNAPALGDKYDLYLANAQLNANLKNGAAAAIGLALTEHNAKTNLDGSGNVAYIAASSGDFFAKTTTPTTNSFAVTYNGKNTVLYYVDYVGTDAGMFFYAEKANYFDNWGMKCTQLDNTTWTAEKKAKDYMILANGNIFMVDYTPTTAGAQNVLLGNLVVTAELGYGPYTVKDHTFVANNYKYDSKTMTNVPTSAVCTTCLKQTSNIYKNWLVPATYKVYGLTASGNNGTYVVGLTTADAATMGGSVVAPSTPSTDKVTSADTFDAGIAMYVGMSVMAAAGSAVVIGKKKD